jgi:hypothetical protein
MFENVLKELEALAKVTSMEVPLEADSDGYFDKECPAEACLFLFKVHQDDWQALPTDHTVHCPSCRHAAGTQSWYTTEQIERSKEYAVKSLQGRINGAMRKDAAAWNRRQPRNAFVRMTMDFKGSSPVLMPIAAAEPMRLRATCEHCKCRYSFVGAAYFCPCCGVNSADHTFKQTLETIRVAAGMGSKLSQIVNADEAEVLTRTLLEKGMQDTVTSFQRLAEQLYERVPGAAPARRNAFQNLNAGSELWRSALVGSYSDWVDAPLLMQLKRYFQQRHLLAHQQGIVDQDYIDRSGDRTYSVGQRVIIKPDDVLAFVSATERLAGELVMRVSKTSP